ncbi:hypothetical protein AALB16_06060 [Lachnospiraceae bacterium 62-35]
MDPLAGNTNYRKKYAAEKNMRKQYIKEGSRHSGVMPLFSAFIVKVLSGNYGMDVLACTSI